jgi:curved DNA-binding protein CbpA
MNLNSPLFDRIRVKPADDPTARPEERRCDHPGCAMAGHHRAPMGRGREGRYFLFCLEHVRAYNQSYNYFKGMDDGDVAAYQKDALTGHRPTWRMGAGGTAREARPGRGDPSYADPFDILGAGGFHPHRKPREERPSVGNAARKAMETLGVEPGTPGPDIKARYKELVKRLHPDANGGDRSQEDQLREIIRAYNLLRSTGMV